jgi:hypothetical protein
LRLRASSLPTVVLPAPIMPISIKQVTRESPEVQMKKGGHPLGMPAPTLYQQTEGLTAGSAHQRRYAA